VKQAEATKLPQAMIECQGSHVHAQAKWACVSDPPSQQDPLVMPHFFVPATLAQVVACVVILMVVAVAVLFRVSGSGYDGIGSGGGGGGGSWLGW